MAQYLSKTWNGLAVSYTDELNGGGLTFADDFLDLFKEFTIKPSFGRIYEWCSGPGFVGYSILANGIGTSLCLADFYAAAVDAAKHTAKANKIEDRVSIYLGDGVMVLPDNEVFDLIVGNPPHFPERHMSEYCYEFGPRIYVDPEWRLHKQFFKNIRKHLSQEGLIVLAENSQGSHVETFRKDIEAAGLKVLGWQWSRRYGGQYWYIFIGRDDATRAPDPFFTRPQRHNGGDS